MRAEKQCLILGYDSLVDEDRSAQGFHDRLSKDDIAEIEVLYAAGVPAHQCKNYAVVDDQKWIPQPLLL